MEIKENTPIMVFDNQCYLCVKFAKVVDFFARGKISMVGHYSSFGMKIRTDILDESALKMFWFIDKNIVYGGRAALFPLLKSVLSNKIKKSSVIKIDENCNQDCKTIKSVFVRSFSVLTNSKKIVLK
ncbi:hypothetical protein BD31_I1321 [Candidatus Nitrosopumilus salaria BD31]|uniref:DUF393 domain-containing protein n=1 Tax=Candidatus Nitrosopumilus salarius BD31 TaxID=859350 RepID=I3D1G0_9ARCH|nr:hypothetical protein [Candidatus Nitrosopumilus salaria]EIJ65553.1 hypothetical protein BD31_I1321 [Candidatus Nitrosopumilus salaria BD31]